MRRTVFAVALLLMGLLLGCPTSTNAAPAGPSTTANAPADLHLDTPVVFVESVPSEILSLSWSPVGDRLAVTAGSDIKIWDLQSGREWQTLIGHTNQVVAVAYSADGRTLASGGRDGAVLLWDALSAHLKRTLLLTRPATDAKPVRSVSISADGRAIAASYVFGEVGVWSADAGLLLQTLHETPSRANQYPIVLAPDGARVYTANGSDIHVWDVATGHLLSTFKGHTEAVTRLALSGDGRTLVSASDDGTLRVWNAATGAARGPIGRPGCTRRISCWSSLGLSSDGKMVASHLESQELEIRDVDTGALRKTIGAEATRLAFSPDGERLALGGHSIIQIWSMKDFSLISTVIDHRLAVQSAAFSRDSRTAAVAYSNQNRVVRIAVAGGKDESVLIQAAGPGFVYSFSLAPDDLAGALITGFGKVVASWQRPGAEPVPLDGAGNVFGRVVVSPDGRLVAAASRTAVTIWDAGTHQRRAEIPLVQVSQIAFSPDGRVLAMNVGKDLSTWDVAAGHVLQRVPSLQTVVGLTVLAYSASGANLAVGDYEGDITIRDASTLTVTRTVKTPADVVALQWFDKDRWLVAAGIDGSLRIRDMTRNDAALRELTGQTSATRALAMTPDGKQLISMDTERTLRFWSVESGKLLYSVISKPSGAQIVITPEGYYATTGPNAEQSINVRIGSRVFGIENYRERFYRPDLVEQVRSGKPLPPLPTLSSVGVAPMVQIVDLPARVTAEQLPLRLNIADAGGGIGDVRVLLNGAAVAANSGRNLTSTDMPQAPNATHTIPIRLVNGTNHLTVIAFNADNSMSSNPVNGVVEAQLPRVEKPQLHALVVGIQQYDNPKLTLRYPKADAEAFAKILAQKAKGLFDTVDVRLRTAPAQTTRAALLKDFEELKNIHPDDVFVFYVASHGTVEDIDSATKEYFLITSNVGSISPDAIERDALGKDELTRLIASIPATKKVLFLDTCQSGAFGEGLLANAGGRGLSDAAAINILSQAVGSTILTASTSDQEALEGYKDHGIFTYVLLDALSGKADAAKRGYVTTTAIAEYLEDEVPKLADQVFKRKQFPTNFISGQGFPVVSSQ
jgi:WD40 repeat protein